MISFLCNIYYIIINQLNKATIKRLESDVVEQNASVNGCYLEANEVARLNKLGIDLICVEEGNVGNYYDLAKNIHRYRFIKR